MNGFSIHNNSIALLFAILTFFLMTSFVLTAPLDSEDEPGENMLIGRPVMGDADMTWDAINTAALRKMLLQMDAEERLGLNRESRSWPRQSRGWGARSLDGQINRPWRADKRQARFRQCYFNPISCFRK
ncbi:unnamed protein product [Pieris macdunnoughi]|uniref:Uncharacterized protein n=1 Tax=Pieris macdunnoughi TaxID=345717 RepID=A0A821W4C5_9NEOP|nr:unnamed protein product [Pieris macdunnoughi]